MADRISNRRKKVKLKQVNIGLKIASRDYIKKLRHVIVEIRTETELTLGTRIVFGQPQQPRPPPLTNGRAWPTYRGGWCGLHQGVYP